jgi:hypothetical protein
MKLPPDIPRCSDALDAGCPERKQCARWVDRLTGHVWVAFAKHRTETGCGAIIKMETSDER